MPSAAARSSMARMCRVFAFISASRRAAKVAIDTKSSWLAEVGRESTEAGCASDLFSDASAAAVTCAIMKPELTPLSRREEWRQAAQRGIDQQRDAPLRQRAHLRDGDGERIGCDGHRFGVEIAARQHVAIVEHQRIVGRRIGFDGEDATRRIASCRDKAPAPAAGSGWNRDPAPACNRDAICGCRCPPSVRATLPQPSICPLCPRAS